MKNINQRAFTIVELLIVIVVIGILAAITIVVYNGVQQRANNAARIQAANQVKKLVQLYKTENGVYPNTTTTCATVEMNCTAYSGTIITSSNSTLITNLSSLGTLPKSVPIQADMLYGITYNYRSTMTYNSDASFRVLMMYWLEGNNQACGIPDVTVQGTATVPDPDPWLSSTTGRTASGSGRTTCYVAI